MTFREIIAAHFEKLAEFGILVFIFVFATVMLAFFPMREEMARWIENGAVIVILARSFGTAKADAKPGSEPKNGIEPAP
jgi:hypothetical protein